MIGYKEKSQSLKTAAYGKQFTNESITLTIGRDHPLGAAILNSKKENSNNCNTSKIYIVDPKD